MDNKIPLDEQETIINLVPPQVSQDAAVYSCIPSMVRRLEKLAEERPDVVRIISRDERSVMASVDRSCIKIAPRRKLTDEQRQAATERLADARMKKGAST